MTLNDVRKEQSSRDNGYHATQADAINSTRDSHVINKSVSS